MLKKLNLLFLSLFLCFGIFGNDYYADLKINVDELGKTSIYGITNYEEIFVTDSDIFTSKSGVNWIFEISVPIEYSEFIYELNLPYGAQTNYIKTTPTFRIANGDDENIRIIGTGENRKLNILVQYSFSEKSGGITYIGYYFSYIVLGLTILFITLVIIFKYIKKSKIVEEIISEVEEIEHKVIGIDYNKYNLNQRQEHIIEILKKYGEISQKKLETELGIPKASVSRNLQSLSSKKLVLIKKNGITNIVSLL